MPSGGCAPRTERRREAASEVARIGAAVEQDVLPGHEAGIGAAHERTGLAELLRRTEAAGGILHAALLVERVAALAGLSPREADWGAWKSGVEGRSVSGRVDFGGARTIKKK